MNVKKISVKVILLCSFTMAMFLSSLIIVTRASIVSIATVVILIGAYIAGELFLWKRKMDEEEKELLHLGLGNIALSVTFLILAIVFLIYIYEARGGLLSILLLSVYCLSGIFFIRIYLKRARSNGGEKKRTAIVSIGPIAGGVIGIGGAKLFLKDASQNTMGLILIFIGCFLSIAFLMMALSHYCKYILKRKERIIAYQKTEEKTPND